VRADAVNGVIHIITRQAGSERGGLLSVSAGDEERASETARWDGQAGKSLGYRVYLKNTDRDQGLTTLPDGDAGHMPWKDIHGGGRADWQVSIKDSLTIAGEVSGSQLSEGFQPFWIATRIWAGIAHKQRLRLRRRFCNGNESLRTHRTCACSSFTNSTVTISLPPPRKTSRWRIWIFNTGRCFHRGTN
jgi:hypothetical protein